MPLAAPGGGPGSSQAGEAFTEDHTGKGCLAPWKGQQVQTEGKSLPYRAGPACAREATRHGAPPSLRRAWKWPLGSRLRQPSEPDLGGSCSPPTKMFLSKPRPGRQAGGAAPIPTDRWECGPASLCRLLGSKAEVSVQSHTQLLWQVGPGGQLGVGTLDSEQSSLLDTGWLSCVFLSVNT